MNTEPTSLDLRHAMVQVVEEALLTFVDEPQAVLKWSDVVLAARLQIHHPYRGELILVAVPDWCSQAAASFLGLDKPDEKSAAQRGDALGELLNMVCGIFVSEGQNLRPRSDFGVPHIDRIERQTLDELIAKASSHVILETESGDPLALLFMKNTLESS